MVLSVVLISIFEKNHKNHDHTSKAGCDNNFEVILPTQMIFLGFGIFMFYFAVIRPIRNIEFPGFY